MAASLGPGWHHLGANAAKLNAPCTQNFHCVNQYPARQLLPSATAWQCQQFFPGIEQFFPRGILSLFALRSQPQREEARNTLQSTANARSEPRARRDVRAIRESGGLSRFLLCRFNVTVSRLFGPASPTASPESEFLSHGRVASRGVSKGAPHKF